LQNEHYRLLKKADIFCAYSINFINLPINILYLTKKNELSIIKHFSKESLKKAAGRFLFKR